MNFDPYLAKCKRNMGENLCNLGLGKDFLNTKNTIHEKKKPDKLDFIKIKTFYSSKDTVRGMKRKI